MCTDLCSLIHYIVLLLYDSIDLTYMEQAFTVLPLYKELIGGGYKIWVYRYGHNLFPQKTFEPPQIVHSFDDLQL